MTCEACTDPIGGTPTCDVCKLLLTSVVAASSHRGRQKLYRLVEPIESLYSLERGQSFAKGGIFRIPAGYLNEARAITGITKTRDGDDLMRCWTT